MEIPVVLLLKTTVTHGNFCRKNCKPYGYGNGLGYEMPCGPVDGMNPVKVAEAMTEAIEEHVVETDQHFLK
jgi:TPP-dependent pyruvate/acetoin dehydrogenase alpha subunit